MDTNDRWGLRVIDGYITPRKGTCHWSTSQTHQLILREVQPTGDCINVYPEGSQSGSGAALLFVSQSHTELFTFVLHNMLKLVASVTGWWSDQDKVVQVVVNTNYATLVYIPL